MKEKHVFAGNNTSVGFYSYFNYTFNPEEANHIYILKGGPGVGKSSFMKKIGTRMMKKGYDVEYVHCSSDNDSLDGILIPKLKIAFVDGTAPHTIDPKIPGAVDEIVNLGTYLDNKKLEENRQEIMLITKKKSNIYKSAYRYLECAGLISEEIQSIYDEVTNYSKFWNLCKEVSSKFFSNSLQDDEYQSPGKIKKLFSEAYTANGYIQYTESLCKDKKVWAINGKNKNASAKLLNFIADEALERGYDVEGYYDPLTPGKLQHIFVPPLDAMIITSEDSSRQKYNAVINLNHIIDYKKIKDQEELENNIQLYELLINLALIKLSETKQEHERLEAYYVKSMDFKGVDKFFEELYKKFEK
ncbi:ATPase [Anaerocolumna sp.]|uniref:ATPase n=1 Tax=Anaerocolumna sp. TaxID=2041569 RepID=UPI0028A9EF5F|nr:ATPase [Anaerocolumna sp.]